MNEEARPRPARPRAHQVTVPRLGWSMTEGTFLGWLKRHGDLVRVGEPLFTLEGDKASQDVEATESGALHILPDAPVAGTVVKVGDLLAYLIGEAVGTVASPPSDSPDPTPVPVQVSPAGPAASASAPRSDAAELPPANSRAGRLLITPRAARVAGELGIDGSQLAGTGKGGRVRERDVRAAAAGATAVPAAAAPAPRFISYAALHDFSREAFQSVGMSRTDAMTAADVLVTTDAWGIHTHGTKLLAGYLRRLKAGGLRAAGRPRIAAEGGGWASVDGDSSLAMVTSVFAMHTAIAKARQQGIAYVGVHNSCHFGAAGYYAWLAAREGLIGIAMANDIPSVSAPGSRGAITGSNPLAYAVPAGRHPPLLLDISTATVAGGKVYAARARGETIPANWIIDGEGRPTTDPSGFPQVGALVPMAGHKGYGLSLLIETLSGVLSGAAMTWGVRSWAHDDDTLPTGHGAAFLALDVNVISARDVFERKMEALIDEIHAAPRADGVNRLLVPGEPEWERHARARREGIPLPMDVWETLAKASELTGVPLPG